MTMRQLLMQSSAFGLIGWSVAFGQVTHPATYQGLFVIVDPYASGCSSFSPNWLVGTGTNICDPGGWIDGLFRSGTLSGIFLHVAWNDYAADQHATSGSGTTTLHTLIQSFQAKIARSSQPISFTIGLQAGSATPCELFSNSSSTGVLGAPVLALDPNSTMPNGYQCDLVPNVWEGEFVQYESALNTLIADVSSALVSGGAAWGKVTALKLSGGINIDDQELHQPGASGSTSKTVSTSCTTSAGSVYSFDCPTSSGATAMLGSDYLPSGLEATFDDIAANDWSHSSSLTGLILEIDALDTNILPPIISQNQPGSGQGGKNFNCNYTPGSGNNCVVDQSSNPYTDDGTYFVEDMLIDLANGAVNGLTMSHVSLQNDGLTDTSLNGSLGNGTNTLPCWGYANVRTRVGFQMSQTISGSETISGTGTYVLTDAMTQAANFGADYVEVRSSQLYNYLTSGGTTTALGTVQTSLLSTGRPVCP